MKVLSVGQCWPDHMALQSFLQGNFAVEVEKSDSQLDALEKIRSRPGEYRLVLVNRILDSTGEAGLELIEKLNSGKEGGPACVLVSNFPEAQKEARELGALPGFGKAGLGAAAVECLKPVLAPAP